MHLASRHPARHSTIWSAAVDLEISIEVVIQLVLCGLAALLGTVLNQAGMISVEHSFTVLASSITAAAAILLVLVGWLSTDRPAGRIAFAVMACGMAFLFAKAVEPDLATNGLLVRDITMIGVGVPFGSALIVQGIRSTTPLLRQAGLALLTLASAPILRITQDVPASAPVPIVSALELAGVAMLLVSAVSPVARALRTVWREQAESESRLHEAEHAMARTAVRDHEMRNLVAGLSGAMNVLTAQQPAVGDSPEGSQLRSATRTELERLRRMLDSDQDIELAPSPVAVGPLLSDLAALHNTQGAVIEVDVTDDCHVLMSPDHLAHVVTNLLVNCARHARGARVWLSSYHLDDQVIIEVTDDGPGLPPGLTTPLLRPGIRGPSSTGTGLGLSISAQLVHRYHGALHLLPAPVGGRGCTVVVELPDASASSRPQKPLAG